MSPDWAASRFTSGTPWAATATFTGQMTYDMFNQPLTNSLAGTIDPEQRERCVSDYGQPAEQRGWCYRSNRNRHHRHDRDLPEVRSRTG